MWTLLTEDIVGMIEKRYYLYEVEVNKIKDDRQSAYVTTCPAGVKTLYRPRSALYPNTRNKLQVYCRLQYY